MSPDFEVFYRAHRRYVWGLARRLGVPERDAEDLVHDVFFAVMHRMDDYDPTRSARAWLGGFTWHMARNYARRGSSRNVLGVPDETASEAPAPAALTEQRQLIARLDRALQRLPEKPREVFVLITCGGLTAAEVAAIVGRPVDTVSSQLRAARREMEAVLAAMKARES